jgi:two-component system CAI-1 autoinducer sensor kinase/phosphatase CqsS
MPILNVKCLDDLKRISPALLEESLAAWSVQIKLLPQRIRTSTANGQFEEMHDALHSLLGISSSAGALALPQFIKKHVYPAIDEGRWPDEDQWVETIEELSAATVRAIESYQEKSLPA